MYRPFRARRILKWTGTAISLLILVAWVGSLWCALNLVFSEYCGAFIDAGTVAIIRMNEHWLRGATAAGEFEWHGWDGFHFGWPRAEFNSIAPDSQTVRMSLVVLPLWLPFLLTAIPTAWLWHRDRRRIRPGCCIRCGYDLTGNTSGVCPECGDKARPPAV